jgi:hypothetical protein
VGEVEEHILFAFSVKGRKKGKRRRGGETNPIKRRRDESVLECRDGTTK